MIVAVWLFLHCVHMYSMWHCCVVAKCLGRSSCFCCEGYHTGELLLLDGSQDPPTERKTYTWVGVYGSFGLENFRLLLCHTLVIPAVDELLLYSVALMNVLLFSDFLCSVTNAFEVYRRTCSPEEIARLRQELSAGMLLYIMTVLGCMLITDKKCRSLCQHCKWLWCYVVQVILKTSVYSHLTSQSLQIWWKSIFVNYPILSFQKTAIPVILRQQVCSNQRVISTKYICTAFMNVYFA